MYENIKYLFRKYGVSIECRGSMYLYKILKGELALEELNEDQIELIVDAWDSRKFIPTEKFKKLVSKSSRVKPYKTPCEPYEYYQKRFAANIVEFFKKRM